MKYCNLIGDISNLYMDEEYLHAKREYSNGEIGVYSTYLNFYRDSFIKDLLSAELIKKGTLKETALMSNSVRDILKNQLTLLEKRYYDSFSLSTANLGISCPLDMYISKFISNRIGTYADLGISVYAVREDKHSRAYSGCYENCLALVLDASKECIILNQKVPDLRVDPVISQVNKKKRGYSSEVFNITLWLGGDKLQVYTFCKCPYGVEGSLMMYLLRVEEIKAV